MNEVMETTHDNNFELLELFPTLIYKKRLQQIPNLTELLCNSEFKRYEQDKCWLTNNSILEKYADLSNVIYKEFDNYVSNVLKVDTSNINFYICRSWLVKHKIGDFGKSHAHVNSLVSGILYLKVDENSGNIIFEKTDYNIFPQFKFDVKQWNRYNAETWSINPAVGDLLFFPSHLKHSVTENLSIEDRCVLVFDFYFKGSIGTHLFQLTKK